MSFVAAKYYTQRFGVNFYWEFRPVSLFVNKKLKIAQSLRTTKPPV